MSVAPISGAPGAVTRAARSYTILALGHDVPPGIVRYFDAVLSSIPTPTRPGRSNTALSHRLCARAEEVLSTMAP